MSNTIAEHSHLIKRENAPGGSTAARCRWVLAALVAANLLGHLVYLSADCPVGLAADEAYYWDWSRNPDYHYYSKGPVTPWLIRGGCALLGDTMLGVRLPALLLRAGLTLCIYWIARRLFQSERIALGAAALGMVTPMFMAAGLVITTDPPFLFCWALATCFAVAAIFDGRRWAWAAAGVMVGLGFLTKFSMPVWLAGIFLFLLIDSQRRGLLRTTGPWVMLAVALPFALPLLFYNIEHGFVTFRHVGEDVGVSKGSLAWANVAAFWLGQALVIGPVLFALAICAALTAIRGGRPDEPASSSRSAQRFLLCLSLPIFLGVLATSFQRPAHHNWTVSSYVALLILTAHFLSRRMHQRGWRWTLYLAAAVGLILVGLAHYTHALYPIVVKLNQGRAQELTAPDVDPTYRLHGWRGTGEHVARIMEQTQASALLAYDYPIAAAMAFYLPGQPRTYHAGSYFTDPLVREPFCQYDLWEDRRLTPEAVRARGMERQTLLYIGPMTADLRSACDSVEAMPVYEVRRHGVLVRRVEIWVCKGFKGMRWPGWNGRYN